MGLCWELLKSSWFLGFQVRVWAMLSACSGDPGAMGQEAGLTFPLSSPHAGSRPGGTTGSMLCACGADAPQTCYNAQIWAYGVHRGPQARGDHSSWWSDIVALAASGPQQQFRGWCKQPAASRCKITSPKWIFCPYSLLVCSLCPGTWQLISLPNSCSFPAVILTFAVVLESILLCTACTPSLGPAELLT